MTLHLVKLCVGIESPEQLQERIKVREKLEKMTSSTTFQPTHTTRMIPRRKSELLDGGSLYWVIKGQIQARQKLIDIEPFTDGDGITRCHLILDKHPILTSWQPRRAFQGWRYLNEEDAPKDLSASEIDQSGAQKLKLELSELGLV